MSRDFTALVALAGLAPDRRPRVASVLAAPFQLQTIAGSRSRRGSLSRTSPCPLADPGTRNWKRAGTPPLLFKKERSRLEQAPGHKALPDADKRRVVGVGVVNVLVRFARVLCVCVCVWCVRVACSILASTLPFTFGQLPFDKSQLRYLCISSITRRSLYRFRTR